MPYNSRRDNSLNSDRNVIRGGRANDNRPKKPGAEQPPKEQVDAQPMPKPGQDGPPPQSQDKPAPAKPQYLKKPVDAPTDYKPSAPGMRWSKNQGKEVMGKPQPAPQTNTPGPAPVEGKPVVPQGGVQDVAANAPAGGASPQQNYDLSPTGQAAAKGMSGGSSVPQGPQVGGNMAPPQGGTTSMSNPGGQQGWTQEQMNNATPMGQSTGGNYTALPAQVSTMGDGGPGMSGRGVALPYPGGPGMEGVKPNNPQLPQWAQQQGKTNDQYMDYLKANPQAAGNQNAGWQQMIQQRDMFNRFNPGGPMNPNPQQPPTPQPPLSYADIGNKPGVIAGPDGKPMMDPKFQPPAGAQPGGNMTPPWMGGGPGGNMRPPFMPPWMPGPQGPMGGFPPQGGQSGQGQLPGGGQQMPPYMLWQQMMQMQQQNPQQQMNPLSPFPGMR